MASIIIYPLLRNYDVWGEIVGINWNTMACKWRDYHHSSSFFLRVSAVFHCLFFLRGSVVFLGSIVLDGPSVLRSPEAIQMLAATHT